MINFFIKNRFIVLLIFISILYFLEKNDTVKSLFSILRFSESERITKNYGFCGGESIGYLNYVNKKLNFKSNPKIINYDHTPPNLWSIYNSNYNNKKNKFIILLNYPGEIIEVNIDKNKDNFFEIPDVYFLSLVTNKILSLVVEEKNPKILEIQFYELDKNNHYIKTKKRILNKKNHKKNFIVNLSLNEFDIEENRLFFKLKKNYSQVKIILQNKFMIDKYKIIDQFNNCYVLER